MRADAEGALQAVAEQYPGPGEIFVDHAGIFVDEFDQSGRAMERLGFSLTPLRLHTSALTPDDPPTLLGTGNRSAMLRQGYIELLGATGETPMAAQLRRQLARHPGWNLIAFTGQGAEAHHAALRAGGLDPLPIARIERANETPDGETEVRARIVRLPPEAWPEGRVQVVFPDMPAEALWHPQLIRHANAADRLSELLLVVEEPAERAAAFGRFTARPVRETRGRHVLETDRGRLHFVDPDGARRLVPDLAISTLPFFAAAAIGSRELAETRALLDRRGIAYAEYRGTLQSAAHEAVGATFIFHDREDDRVLDGFDG